MFDGATIEKNGESESEEQNFDANVLVQPEVDTLESLIAKQIIVHQTAPGDTLASIAKQNGISIETLMWANKLDSQNIRPGWFLIILPTDGTLHKATSNDTLPDLAKNTKAAFKQLFHITGWKTRKI